MIKAALILFATVQLSLAAKILRSAPTMPRDHLNIKQNKANNNCDGVDTCWLALFDELNAAQGVHNGECKAWKHYARCLRSYAVECKDDFYYTTQLRSVRLRIKQLACQRGASLKIATTLMMTAPTTTTTTTETPVLLDNVQPVVYPPAQQNNDKDTLVCQSFGYGHVRTFNGDVMTCRHNNGQVASLFEINGVFKVKGHYFQQDPMMMPQLHNISITFASQSGLLVTFSLISTNDTILMSQSSGSIDEDDVLVNYARSDAIFSVVNVVVKRLGLKIRLRKRRVDASIHSVTLQATVSPGQLERRRLRSILLDNSGDLCVTGCNYFPDPGAKIDLATEIARRRFEQNAIREARRTCTSALMAENEYLTPCIFDHLVNNNNNNNNNADDSSLCKEATPYCARYASHDLAAHLVRRVQHHHRNYNRYQPQTSFYLERRRVFISTSLNNFAATRSSSIMSRLFTAIISSTLIISTLRW